MSECSIVLVRSRRRCPSSVSHTSLVPMRSPSSPPKTVYMLPLWTGFCLLVPFGSLWLFMRINCFVPSNWDRLPILNGFINQSRVELTPTTFQDRCSVEWRKQGIVPKAFIWSLSMVTLANLPLGPWSSPACCSFSIKGVMYIVGRYLANTIVCRGIVRLEHSALNGKGILFGQSSETRALAAR